MNIKLMAPILEMEQEYNDYISEWEQAEKAIIPYSSRPLGREFKTWLEDTYKFEKEETCPTDFVPAYTYFLVNNSGKILGALNLRLYLNEYLLNFGGHIGYGIRPSERHKGYATQMLALALPIVKNLGISKVLITCDKSNIGSAKTIINNGGVLENEVREDGKIVQRYWIDIDKKEL